MNGSVLAFSLFVGVVVGVVLVFAGAVSLDGVVEGLPLSLEGNVPVLGVVAGVVVGVVDGVVDGLGVVSP